VPAGDRLDARAREVLVDDALRELDLARRVGGVRRTRRCAIAEHLGDVHDGSCALADP
jgi:hypothetical protein